MTETTQNFDLLLNGMDVFLRLEEVLMSDDLEGNELLVFRCGVLGQIDLRRFAFTYAGEELIFAIESAIRDFSVLAAHDGCFFV